MRLRHLKKANVDIQKLLPKPPWLRVRARNGKVFSMIKDKIFARLLVTVFEEAGHPNIGECWSKPHATFYNNGHTQLR